MNFENAYESDDSEDDKPKQKLPKVVDLSDALRPQKRDPQADQELKLENIIAFNKRKRQQMLKNMIKNQQSLAKTNADMLKARGDGELFKRKVWKQELRARIDYRRTENLKKINKVKIKTKKI